MDILTFGPFPRVREVFSDKQSRVAAAARKQNSMALRCQEMEM